MKIEKINENKIKITFNIDDLAEKNIDLYSFMHNTAETQDLFWDILNEAEKECGFNVDNSMIYIEATTSGAGNFILTVTKTNEKPVSIGKSTTKRKNLRLKRKFAPIANAKNIYQFDTFDDICEFSRIINIKAISENSLYSMNDKYYLNIDSMPYNDILEYSTICNPANAYVAKLSEYGNLLIHNNALQTIDKYFNKKRRKS